MSRMQGTHSARYKNLLVHVFRFAGVETRYDATSGLKWRLLLIGRIDAEPNALGFPESSKFDDKLVRIDIRSPPDRMWLRKLATALRVRKPIGAVSVRAGVEPERFEIDGETHQIEPIHASVMLSAESFEALCSQAAKAQDRLLQATLVLTGPNLPEEPELPETTRGERVGFKGHSISLKDFDTSEDRTYAIEAVEFSDSTRLVPA